MKINMRRKLIVTIVVLGTIAIGSTTVLGLNGYFGGGGTIPQDTFTLGLVGHWAFEDGVGTNANDSSDSNNDLTLVNTPVWTTGKVYAGLDFESGSSEYGYAADTASLSITGDLTVTVWIKPESVTASTLFDIAGKWDGANESYLLVQYGDEIRMYINAAANYKTTDTVNLATGAWYYVAAGYDASAQTVTLYINGVEETGTVSGTIPSSIGDDAGRFQVGTEDSTTTATNFYDGIVDEVRIYNRTLSAAEVRFHYNRGGPTVHLEFDEGAGTTAFDSSGNSNDGTITNATWDTTGACKFGVCLHFDGSGDLVSIPDF